MPTTTVDTRDTAVSREIKTGQYHIVVSVIQRIIIKFRG